MLWLLVGFFVLLVVWRNVWMFQNFCLPTFDIGIFVDFVRRQAEGVFNPYSDVRQISQFSDHFTPILSLLSWPLALLPQPYGLLLLEVLMIAGCAGLLSLACSRGWIGRGAALYGALLILVNRDVFETAFFPVHPAVWAMPALLWAGLVAHRDLVKGSCRLTLSGHFQILGCLFFAFLTDEQFSFAILGYALALLATEFLTKKSLSTLVAGLSAVWVAHSGRRLLAGEILPYYEQRMPGSFADWLARYSWTLDSWKTGFQFVLVLAPLLFLMRAKPLKSLFAYPRHVLVVGGIFGPLILGRVLTGNFGFHYNTVFIVFFVLIVAFFLDEGKFSAPRRWSVAGGLVLVMLAISVGKWKRPATAQFLGEGLNCKRREVPMEDFRARTKALQQALGAIDHLAQPGERWIALSNLTTNLMSDVPKLRVFCLCGFQIRNVEALDGLMTERGRFGEFVGFRSEFNEKVIEAVRGLPGIEILTDEEDLFVAKGRIPVDLINPYLSPHPEYK